jgi:hypothetical protein
MATGPADRARGNESRLLQAEVSDRTRTRDRLDHNQGVTSGRRRAQRALFRAELPPIRTASTEMRIPVDAGRSGSDSAPIRELGAKPERAWSPERSRRTRPTARLRDDVNVGAPVGKIRQGTATDRTLARTQLAPSIGLRSPLTRSWSRAGPGNLRWRSRSSAARHPTTGLGELEAKYGARAFESLTLEHGGWERDYDVKEHPPAELRRAARLSPLARRLRPPSYTSWSCRATASGRR